MSACVKAGGVSICCNASTIFFSSSMHSTPRMTVYWLWSSCRVLTTATLAHIYTVYYNHIKQRERLTLPIATVYTACTVKLILCPVTGIQCTYILQYFLGQLSQPDICNRLSVIGYRPGDVIMAGVIKPSSAIGTRKTDIKHIQTI